MTISNAALKLAINSLAAIPFFPPKDELIARAKVAESLQSMCADEEQLTWLVYVAINRMSKWGGVAGLREILATKFAPADGLGIEAKGEQLYFDREAAETERKQIAWQMEQRKQIESGESQAPLVLPALKVIPKGKQAPRTGAAAEFKRIQSGYPTPHVPTLRELEERLTPERRPLTDLERAEIAMHFGTPKV